MPYLNKVHIVPSDISDPIRESTHPQSPYFLHPLHRIHIKYHPTFHPYRFRRSGINGFFFFFGWSVKLGNEYFNSKCSVDTISFHPISIGGLIAALYLELWLLPISNAGHINAT